MSEPVFDANALIAASAGLLRIDLADADLAVLKLHLETAERLARLAVDGSLDDEAEPAPVFTP